MSSIPLVDLVSQQREVADEVNEGFAAVLGAGAFIGGKDVGAFEQDYADFVGVGHVVGVANGTDAIELALRGLDIGAGTEVVIPANTFIATAEAVARAGARPVLVDCDDDHLLIDPALVPAAITERTRAVIPVHLYGQAAPVERIVVPAGVEIVEDAAQSQGARRLGRSAGALGRVAATSFYPGKNLGAAGDAGAVLTDDAALARRVRTIGAHGSERRYEHVEMGVNSRLDTLQAVVLRAKLARLAGWNDARRAAAARYEDLLQGVAGVRRPAVAEGNEHVWHLYVIRVDGGAVRRDEVLSRLQASGVGAAIHYPVPVHLQPAFRHLGYAAGDFPVSERSAGEILSLPIYPHITADQQERVVAELARALA